MIYEYKCHHCDKSFDVVKSYTDIDREEHCDECNSAMERIFAFKGYTQVDNFIPGFNYSFGKTFTTKRQQQEHIRRYQAETGKRVFEVGNETPAEKPNTPTYNVKEATRELKYLWRQK